MDDDEVETEWIVSGIVVLQVGHCLLKWASGRGSGSTSGRQGVNGAACHAVPFQ